MFDANNMRILLSALSCNRNHGSEALVGYRYAEALAGKHQVDVIASPPTVVPRGATLYPVSAGKCNFNDVSAVPLAQFEARQLPKAWWLTQRSRIDVVHRVTPSWIGNYSLLPTLKVPFIVGPLLAADRPPESFRAFLTRGDAVQSRQCRLRPGRVVAGVVRRVHDTVCRRNFHLRAARKILVGTRVALEHVPAKLRNKCEEIVYSGVEHDHFVPPHARPDRDPLELLYVGRVVPYKGLELLLRAIALANKRANFHLRVVGSGEPGYLLFCRRLVDELKLASAVEFIPNIAREKLPEVYQSADVFCFPTLCDTYGVALLEAMSCECAVVVSDVGGPREIVSDSTGIKVAMKNPTQYLNDFADALAVLARDPRRRAEYGRRARQQIIQCHDWPSIGRRVLKIYDQL